MNIDSRVFVFSRVGEETKAFHLKKIHNER